MRTATGLEKFAAGAGAPWRRAKLGLLANYASVGPGYAHAIDMLDAALPGAVVALFGPQHGWAGEKQDNMVESAHGRDRRGRPIYSLYGETRRPTAAMLAGLDALVVDLVDVGTRVYTFAHTMNYCLEAAAEAGLEVIVLDRPNPIGGEAMEGPVLEDACRSFVGLQPVPMRHGLTLGELARFINGRLAKAAPLTVVTCDGWRRGQYLDETGLPWVFPSPNLPTVDCARVYPGQVLWEGTNVSEGRGTTRPFNLFGAPFIDPDKLFRDLMALGLPGFRCRRAAFQPTFHKWAGQMCFGLEIFPVSPGFKPFLTSLSLLGIILRNWPGEFRLKEPPYEYEYRRRPIDLILGQADLFGRLAAGETAESLERGWRPGLDAFAAGREGLLLY